MLIPVLDVVDYGDIASFHIVIVLGWGKKQTMGSPTPLIGEV